MKSTILVTGAAGFIGFHVVKKLLTVDNVNVIGYQYFKDYTYDFKQSAWVMKLDFKLYE